MYKTPIDFEESFDVIQMKFGEHFIFKIEDVPKKTDWIFKLSKTKSIDSYMQAKCDIGIPVLVR